MKRAKKATKKVEVKIEQPSYPWKPRPRTKEQKYLRAMRPAHKRRKRSENTPCAMGPLRCKKMALEGDTLCAMHRDNAI